MTNLKNKKDRLCFLLVFSSAALFVVSVILSKIFSFSLNGTWQGMIAFPLVCFPLTCSAWIIGRKIKSAHPLISFALRYFAVLLVVILCASLVNAICNIGT